MYNITKIKIGVPADFFKFKFFYGTGAGRMAQSKSRVKMGLTHNTGYRQYW